MISIIARISGLFDAASLRLDSTLPLFKKLRGNRRHTYYVVWVTRTSTEANKYDLCVFPATIPRRCEDSVPTCTWLTVREEGSICFRRKFVLTVSEEARLTLVRLGRSRPRPEWNSRKARSRTYRPQQVTCNTNYGILILDSSRKHRNILNFFICFIRRFLCVKLRPEFSFTIKNTVRSTTLVKNQRTS